MVTGDGRGGEAGERGAIAKGMCHLKYLVCHVLVHYISILLIA